MVRIFNAIQEKRQLILRLRIPLGFKYSAFTASSSRVRNNFRVSRKVLYQCPIDQQSYHHDSPVVLVFLFVQPKFIIYGTIAVSLQQSQPYILNEFLKQRVVADISRISLLLRDVSIYVHFKH